MKINVDVPLAYIEQAVRDLERNPSKEFIESVYRQLDEKPPRLRNQEAKLEHLKRLLRERLGERGGTPEPILPIVGASEEGGMSSSLNRWFKRQRNIRPTEGRRDMPAPPKDSSKKTTATRSRTESSAKTKSNTKREPVVSPAPRNIWLVPLLAGLAALVLIVGFLTDFGQQRPVEITNADTRANTGYEDDNSLATPNSDEVCRLDKVGTWSEGNNPHRIEVGGHGGQHLDYYPTPGVKSVSYIVDPIPNPQGVPSIVFGYGSIWEGNGSECENFDWLADATAYATARLDSGHSGLVVHNGEVVANVGSLSNQEIDQIVGNFVTETPTDTTDGSTSAVSCEDAVREDHAPELGQSWTPKGSGWRIINFWTNEKGHDQGERKLLLEPGSAPALMGGGASWSWNASCGDVVQQEFAKNSLPTVTLDQLQSEELVR